MLNEQLQKQIEQEGSERAEGWQDKMKAQIAKTEYELGAEKYAEKWQEAQQLVERYEKALKEIQAMNHTTDEGYTMKLKAYWALTPKTGSDE